MAKLLIVGAGGHARVVADIVRLTGAFEVAGFLDDRDPNRAGETFCGSTVIGGLTRLADLAREGVRNAAVAIGDCDARLTLSERLVEAGFDLPLLIHPSAIVAADAAVGAGSVLVAGAIVNSGARVGSSVIVNTAASVDHDCVVEDGAHIACGARLAGHVRVGRGSWIGIGAVVREHVRIGKRVVVGAGALVLKDLPDDVVAYGAPARVVDHV